jgi:hypothetical protein
MATSAPLYEFLLFRGLGIRLAKLVVQDAGGLCEESDERPG